MSVQEFLTAQLNDVGNQLTAVFANYPEQNWHEKVTPEAMSAAETAYHLADCYNAFLTSAAGGKHEWGSTVIEDQTPTGQINAMLALRAKCLDIAASSDDPKIHTMASDYISLHDAYHVGQMVTLRIKLEDFDSYNIYK